MSGRVSLLRTPHVAQASPHPEGENIRKKGPITSSCLIFSIHHPTSWPPQPHPPFSLISLLSITGHGWGGIAGSSALKRGASARRSPAAGVVLHDEGGGRLHLGELAALVWRRRWHLGGACSSGAAATWRTKLVVPLLEPRVWRPKPEHRPAAWPTWARRRMSTWGLST
jgi:hypothetical protein